MKTPRAPDPMQTAQAQAGLNRDTALTQAQLNMINQVTPTGNLTYNQTGTNRFQDSRGKWIETPAYTATTTLSPEQQAIFNKTQAAETNLAGIAEQQSAFLGDYLKKPFEFNNQAAEDWAYDIASRRLIPEQEMANEKLRTQLLSQGIRPGTAAYERELTRLTQNQGDQLNNLALSGRQQAFSEALQQRNQPLNEISALLSGSQVSMPQFQQTPQSSVGGVDYTGLVNQRYQGDLANSQAKMGGLFGLLSGGIGLLSDRRAKTDIERVGETDEGTPIYTYRYKDGGPVMMGVMAQEVAKRNPDAVMKADNGMLAVDYGKVS